MKAEDVAHYLETHPEFFEIYAQMLSEITIPHPYGGRTISLSERQMLSLRERVKELEKKMHELMEFAKENEALQSKVHQFTLTLFDGIDRAARQAAVCRSLCDIFSIPHAALRLWDIEPPSAETLAFTDKMANPVCSHHAMPDIQAWFGEAGSLLHSFAYLPLRDESQTIGLLVLASEDAKRFYPEMGTMFLQRIAESVASALRPRA